DRWGKVLSDYKDVVVHNKEKGAARWTFDFFKEVANIVEGDPQFAEMAATAAQPTPSNTGLGLSIATGAHAMRQVYDESVSQSAGSVGSRGTSHHRLSDTSMQGVHRTQSPPRGVHQYQHQHQHQHKISSSFPPAASAGVISQTQQGPPQAPPMLRRSSQTIPGRHGSSSFSYYPSQQPAHHHPYSRYSPPSHRAPYSGQLTQNTAQPQAPPVPPMHRASSTSVSQTAMTTSGPMPAGSPMIVAQTPVMAGGVSMDNPEQTCRYVLDILDQQMKRIDAQQESLTQLRESTRSAMERVENILQTHIRNN
ncbi:hypothetical protein EC988_001165, partial [Linderina pennispora]